MEKVRFNYNDIPCEFYIGDKDWVSQHYRESNTFYEKTLLDHIYKNFGTGKIFVDVGANIGNHTYFFAHICQAKRVYSFEPSAEYFELLYHNTKNFFDRIKLSNCALSNVCEEEQQKILGKMAIVDKLDNFVDWCDVIKIDVEGMEMEVLEGAKRVIETCHPTIYAEAKDDKALQRIKFFLPEGTYYRITNDFKSGTPVYEFSWIGKTGREWRKALKL